MIVSDGGRYAGHTDKREKEIDGTVKSARAFCRSRVHSVTDGRQRQMPFTATDGDNVWLLDRPSRRRCLASVTRRRHHHHQQSFMLAARESVSAL